MSGFFGLVSVGSVCFNFNLHEWKVICYFNNYDP